MVARKPTETSVFQFSYKSMNSLLEKLTKIKVIFILRQGKFRLQNLKKLVMFLLIKLNAVSHKSLEIQASSCKTKDPFKPNMNELGCFAAEMPHESRNSEESIVSL